MPLGDPCAHIVDEHHARLRWELPRLGELAEAAAAAHGSERPELHALRDELASLREELEEHVDEEERELFPLFAAGAVDRLELVDGLHWLELDLHQHVHEEYNILFPRALAESA